MLLRGHAPHRNGRRVIGFGTAMWRHERERRFVALTECVG